MKKAIVLLSGGLDSTTCLAIAKSQGYDCYALSFSYGQKHSSELGAAKRIAKRYGVREHQIIPLDLQAIGRSALTHQEIHVKDYDGSQEIPTTYVPARNTVFLSIALGWAEVLEAYDIFMGANIVDYSHYPDCRPEYIRAFEALAKLATKAGVEGKDFTVHTPIIHLSKSEIIQAGLNLDVDYSQTISCYRANEKGEACGSCDSCRFRQKGFKEAGVTDPTSYY
jgi:7-cyano-7-deazaguanine synthase